MKVKQINGLLHYFFHWPSLITGPYYCFHALIPEWLYYHMLWFACNSWWLLLLVWRLYLPAIRKIHSFMSSKPSLSLISLLGTLSFTLTSHIHLTILISALWSATSFSFITGQISLSCNKSLGTQLLYSLPLIINDILVSNGNKLPEFIPSNSNSGLYSCISISIHTQHVT